MMVDDQSFVETRNKPRSDTNLADSIVPDAIYRPIPIAWFAAAAILEGIAVCIVYLIFYSVAGWFTVVGAAIASFYIGTMTWRRGMADASSVWKTATVIMLCVYWGLISLAAMAR